jgi:hypothetical protein
MTNRAPFAKLSSDPHRSSPVSAGREGEARRVLAPADGYRHDPGGWTVYTTRLALRALLDTEGFRPGVERVVRLAGDADTNGAVAGALLGARFGAREIPPSWLKALLRKDDLLDPL